MTLKKKFILSNLVMLILPVITIGIVTAMLIGFFAVKYTKIEMILSGSTALGAFDFIKRFLNTNPETVFFLTFWVFISLLVIFFTNMIITHRLTKSIMTPVTELKNAASKIEKGELDFEIMSSKYVELEELCTAFNNMRIRLRTSREKEAQMTEERSLLLARLSHDLKTPITSIHGYAQGLLDGIAEAPEQREKYIRTIMSKAEILRNLADNLSEYSHLEMNKSEFHFTIDSLTDFLSEIYQKYSTDFENAGLSLIYEPSDNPLNITADFDKLFRVFSNLLDNALKYRRPESVCTKINTKIKDGGVYTIIEDDGIGISDENAKKAFDNFYRIDKARTMNVKGNGLGLGIAKQITEKHGGRIWLKSLGEYGTQAIVYLPIKGDNKIE